MSLSFWTRAASRAPRGARPGWLAFIATVKKSWCGSCRAIIEMVLLYAWSSQNCEICRHGKRRHGQIPYQAQRCTLSAGVKAAPRR
jgi:hypothetical protein